MLCCAWSDNTLCAQRANFSVGATRRAQEFVAVPADARLGTFREY